MKFHAQRDGVDDDEGEDDVLERLRGDHPPDFVLEPLLWDVAPEGLGFEGEFDAVALVLVQLAVAVLLLTLVLEGDDDETHKDVDHKEGDDDDVNKIETGDHGPVIVHGTHVLGVRIDRHVEEPERKRQKSASIRKAAGQILFSFRTRAILRRWTR